MKKYTSCARTGSIILSIAILMCPLGTRAQDDEFTQYERDTLVAAAIEIMETARYCALITLDESGHPQARTMDPFLPEEDMVVWLGTNTNSRKVHEIQLDSRVTLYYEAPGGNGYVVIRGNGFLMDDPELIEQYWKEEWEQFYPDKYSTFTLIKVIPKKLEIISYAYGITGSSMTWAVPYMEF